MLTEYKVKVKGHLYHDSISLKKPTFILCVYCNEKLFLFRFLLSHILARLASTSKIREIKECKKGNGHNRCFIRDIKGHCAAAIPLWYLFLS